MKTKSPLRYMGGKSYMLDSIYDVFPNHKTFVDVFGGAGHVVLSKPVSNINIYNDKNNNLVNLFLCMRDNKEELMARLDSLFYSREIHDRYSKLYKQHEYNFLPEIEKSVIYYYLIISSFNGDPRDSFSTASTRNKASQYFDKLKNIKNIFKEILIERLDFKDCIEKYDTEDTLFYVDPPYYGTEKYYEVLFTEKDHQDLHDSLKNIKGKFILSYYPCIITEKYKNWCYITEHKRKKYSSTSQNRKDSIELLITNYEQHQHQHILNDKKSLFDF